MDCSLPGSSVPGIFQARILEWVAIFSLQGTFLTGGSNPWLLYWQADSLPLSHLGNLFILSLSPLNSLPKKWVSGFVLDWVNLGIRSNSVQGPGTKQCVLCCLEQHSFLVCLSGSPDTLSTLAVMRSWPVCLFQVSSLTFALELGLACRIFVFSSSCCLEITCIVIWGGRQSSLVHECFSSGLQAVLNLNMKPESFFS